MIEMYKRILATLCCGIVILINGCEVQAPQATIQEQSEIEVETTITANEEQNTNNINQALTELETTTVNNEEYYVLTNGEELMEIGNAYPLSANYILKSNITLSGEWIPIGNSVEPFTGIFDGNGYRIENLTVTEKADEIGFFGATKDAIIKDLVIENSHIDIFAFFPIVCNAENTEITGCSINEGSQKASSSQENNHIVYGFDEEEKLIESLIAANYQDMALSDFQAFTLEVFNDTDTLASVLSNLENYFDDGSQEAEIVAYSLPATYSELISDNNSGTFTNQLKKERAAGRTVMDTIEFSCIVEYTLSYEISNAKLTVSERDKVLESVHRQMQEYVDNANEDFLTSSEAGYAIKEQLQTVVRECVVDGISMRVNLTDVSILDANGEYQTVFPVE